MLRFLAIILMLAGAYAAEPERIPADSRWVLRLDVRALDKTQLGAILKEQASKPTPAARLALLEAVSGLRLERDIDIVTLCGTDGREENGLIYLRGRFDAQKLQTLVQAAEDHRTVQVGMNIVHLWKDGGKPTPVAATLARPDLLILAKGEARMRLALAALEAPVAHPAVALPAGWEGSCLAACAATDLDGWQGEKPGANVLKHLQRIALRLDEQGSDLVLAGTATATSEAQAEQMANLARGLTALVQLQGQADPALLAALASLKLERSGADLKLEAHLPVESAKRLIGQAADQQLIKHAVEQHR